MLSDAMVDWNTVYPASVDVEIFMCCFMLQNVSVASLLTGHESLSMKTFQDIVKMLLLAGYNSHKDRYVLTYRLSPPASESQLVTEFSAQQRPTQLNIDVLHTPFTDKMLWLLSQTDSTWSLRNLCRTRIRKRLSYCSAGRSVVNLVSTLPLPGMLKDFVSFKGDGLLDSTSFSLCLQA